MIAFTLLAVFVGAFSLIVGAYMFLARRSLARQASARRRLSDAEVVGPAVRLFREDSASSIPIVNEWLEKLEHTRKLRDQLKGAGVNAQPGVIIFAALLLGALGLTVGQALGSLPLGMLLGAVGLAAPYTYLGIRRRKRLDRFESQLPEALDMIVNAMRAGYSFPAAMELVGQEIPDPMGTEFARCHDEQRLGVDTRTAMLRLLDRVPSMDLKMFVTAVLIQRETGGNLGEVLSNISHVIRERFRIQGELKTLTAQVRLSAAILGLLPIAMVGLITLLNPGFIEPLFRNPAGHMLLLTAGTFQVLGFVIMRRIADIEI